MPTFKGSYFSIELPADFSDESTYAFALPARANFRPSVVVKAERLTQPTELGAYVEQQLDKIKKALPSWKSAFARNIGWAMAGEASRQVFRAAYFLLVARALGASHFGEFVGVTAMIAVLSHSSRLDCTPSTIFFTKPSNKLSFEEAGCPSSQPSGFT